MATNITIKRYNGSTWDELNPATTIGQVSGLQTALDGKQLTSNLVTSVSSSSTDTQYPSAKLFYDTTTGIAATAEGKSKSYVTTLYPIPNSDDKCIVVGETSLAVNTDISTVVGQTGYSTINVSDSTSSLTVGSSNVYLYRLTYDSSQSKYLVLESVQLSTIKIGDLLLITDTNVPDFWFTGLVSGTGYIFSRLEISKVDLADYVTLDTAQTITGAKTFTGTVTISDGVATGATITGGNSLTITNDLAGVQIIGSGETFQVGTSSNKWYFNINGSSGSSGQTLIIDSNGKPNWGTATDNDHYPTTFTWSNGTTAGPTGSLTGNSGFSAVSFGAIPAATDSQSGVVTTSAQTFLGNKTFKNRILVSSSSDDNVGSFIYQGY